MASVKATKRGIDWVNYEVIKTLNLRVFFEYNDVMAIPTTPAEFLDILKNLQGNKADDVSARQKYRYVIYARKSTDVAEKQVRSLSDQVAECQEFAAEHLLDVRDIIQEAESAKEPDIRPKFKKMIEDVKQGKYDGIIAWHPDRLARNMKDAGEVIDLLDKRIIKDLKFKSFTFENDTSGKMLLGITFVLSKQYSDALSDNISRGNKRSTEEGKYVNKAKHGYYKDPNQFLRPDGDNFLLIKSAFQMRIEGKTLEEIARYLNSHGYQKAKSDGSHVPFKMGFRKVENFMRDPVYTGVVVYGKKGGAVNLMEKYDFVPAITVPDFMKINKLTNNGQFVRLARKYHKGEDVKADLMRGMVTCAECDEVMAAGITIKKNPKKGITRYLYYRCTTIGCPKHNKSVRAKVIVNYIIDFLKQKPFSSKSAYDHYAQEMERVSAQRARETQSLLMVAKAKKSNLENRLQKIRDVLLDEKDEKIKTAYRGDLKKAEKEIVEVVGEIKRLEVLTKANKTAVLTYAEFLELTENMAKIIASIKNMKELDYIIKKMFSNFSVRGENVEKLTLNAPFDVLYELNVANCGDGGI